MKSAITKASVAVLVLLGVVGCGWHTRYRSSSPDGTRELEVKEKQFFTDSRIRITLRRGNEERVIYSENRDWLPGLIEFYWSSGSDIAGLALCNRGSEALVLAVDTGTMRLIDKGFVADKLAQQLRFRYGLSIAQDPFIWACDNEGTQAFYRLSQTK